MQVLKQMKEDMTGHGTTVGQMQSQLNDLFEVARCDGLYRSTVVGAVVVGTEYGGWCCGGGWVVALL